MPKSQELHSLIEEHLTEEEFILHNPAYCGFLIYSFLREYTERNDSGLDSSLLFLCLPLILTKSVRNTFPKKSNSSFLSWANEKRGMLFCFPDYVVSYYEITHAALLFLFEMDLVTVDSLGQFRIKNYNINKSSNIIDSSENMKAQVSAAKFLHVPAHSDHPFRFNPISDFGLIRSLISALSDQK